MRPAGSRVQLDLFISKALSSQKLVPLVTQLVWGLVVNIESVLGRQHQGQVDDRDVPHIRNLL